MEVEENEWYIDQIVQGDSADPSLLGQHGYGFANTHKGLGNKYEVCLGFAGEMQVGIFYLFIASLILIYFWNRLSWEKLQKLKIRILLL